MHQTVQIAEKGWTYCSWCSCLKPMMNCFMIRFEIIRTVADPRLDKSCCPSPLHSSLILHRTRPYAYKLETIADHICSLLGFNSNYTQFTII